MVKIEKRSQNEFAVVVEGKGGKTQHLVSLDDDYYHLLTQGRIDKEELIRKSFQFLLQRNSRCFRSAGRKGSKSEIGADDNNYEREG